MHRTQFLLSLILLGLASPAAAQDSGAAELPTDSASLRERAHEAQRAFESYRESRIPPSTVTRSGRCDERIGRFCLRHDGDDAPIPSEPPEVSLARSRTLGDLARIAGGIPGDDWVFGQRIFYTLESGDLRGAESLARRCPGPSPWWCDALLGFVLHHQDRTLTADSAFSEAIDGMPDDVRRWYRTPEFVLDPEGRELFESSDAEGRREIWSRLWLLSDPLYLVEGNDRFTAHLARKTLVRLRTGTFTPYGLPFDDDPDLEELNIRYGGEVGYERIQSAPRGGVGLPLELRSAMDTRRTVGRHPPDDREYLPTSSFLADPAEIPPGAWTLEEAEPRTGYAAPYARDVRPLPAQVARFRRGDSLLVVASYDVALGAAPAGELAGTPTRRGSDPGRATGAPSRGGGNEPDNPFAGGDADGWFGNDAAGDDAAGADSGVSEEGRGATGDVRGPLVSGLFLKEWSGGTAHELRGRDPEGVVTATVPNGEYVLGLEVWEEDARRAWRLRQGLRQQNLAPGVAAVSDLLFLRPGDDLPGSLEEGLPRVLPAIRVPGGGSFTVAWEVYGLRPGESARVTLGFTEGEPGLLERIGEFLRLVEPEEPVEISFEDRAPDRLGTVFRALDVDVPSFEPGVYTLHLAVELSGRDPLVTSRRLVVD